MVKPGEICRILEQLGRIVGYRIAPLNLQIRQRPSRSKAFDVQKILH